MGIYIRNITKEQFIEDCNEMGVLVITEGISEIDLVRCGECIHHDEDGWGYGECKRPSVDYLRTADEDFCSYGERRADEE